MGPSSLDGFSAHWFQEVFRRQVAPHLQDEPQAIAAFASANRVCKQLAKFAQTSLRVKFDDAAEQQQQQLALIMDQHPWLRKLLVSRLPRVMVPRLTNLETLRQIRLIQPVRDPASSVSRSIEASDTALSTCTKPGALATVQAIDPFIRAGWMSGRVARACAQRSTAARADPMPSFLKTLAQVIASPEYPQLQNAGINLYFCDIALNDEQTQSLIGHLLELQAFSQVKCRPMPFCRPGVQSLSELAGLLDLPAYRLHVNGFVRHCDLHDTGYAPTRETGPGAEKHHFFNAAVLGFADNLAKLMTRTLHAPVEQLDLCNCLIDDVTAQTLIGCVSSLPAATPGLAGLQILRLDLTAAVVGRELTIITLAEALRSGRLPALTSLSVQGTLAASSKKAFWQLLNAAARAPALQQLDLRANTLTPAMLRHLQAMQQAAGPARPLEVLFDEG